MASACRCPLEAFRGLKPQNRDNCLPVRKRSKRPISARIVNAVSQVVVNVVDHGLGIQDAIAAPRLDASGPELLLDSRLPDEVLSGLAALGHAARVVEESFHAAHFSTPLGILIDPRDGRLHGGVHPFKQSVASGD